MARFLLVNQYYWPDFASTGQHLTDLAEHLAAHGHEVRVLTSRGRYLDGRGDAPLRERRGGVSIERVRATSFGKRRALGRLLDYASFHLAAGLRLLTGPRPDVVVTLTTPPLLPVWGALAKRVRGVHLVAFLMDLHPDAEFEQGMLSRDSLAGRLLAALDGASLRAADRCVVLGPHQGERVAAKGVPSERLSTIPIWSDGAELAPLAHETNPVRARLGWRDRFVVLYSGNAGLVHRFDELLDAAARLRTTHPHVLFAFVGGGPRTEEIRAQAAERGLDNVELHPYVPREELRASLSAGDVHFLSLRCEHRGVAVPGKLAGILAVGRPALFVGPPDCENADDVRASGAGWCFEPGQGEALAERIAALAGAPEEVRERGRRARAWFLLNRDRAASCEAWRELLEEISAPVVHPLESASVAPVTTAIDEPAAALPTAARAHETSER